MNLKQPALNEMTNIPMKINVTAKPRSSFEKVKKVDKNNFEVWVKEPPVKGLANMAIRRALADYFKVPQSQVRLILGFSFRNKIFEITT